MPKLVDIEIDEISGVDKAANKRKFLIIKRDKPMKTENGVKFPAEAYAYVPDPEKPSTWKLRLWETPEKKETPRQVGMAIAALGPGFRGNKIEIPVEDLPKVKVKVRAAWKKANPDKSEDEMPEIIRKGRDVMDDITLKEKLWDFVKSLFHIGGDESNNNDDDNMNKLYIEKGKDGDKMSIEEIKKNLPEEAQKYIEELEEKASQVDELTKRVSELEKKDKGEEEHEEEDILKGADPVIKKHIEELQKRVEEAEKIAKEEREKREYQEFLKRAEQYPNVGKTEEIAEMLKKAYGVSKEYGEKLEAVFKAANEQVEKSKLFDEIGRSGGTGGSAVQKAEALANEMIQKNTGMTKEQAMARVWMEHPELYAEYEKEVKGGIK